MQDLTDDPSVGGIVATTRDVTERARAEAMMASQAQILRLIAKVRRSPRRSPRSARVVEQQMPEALCSVMLVDEAEHVLRIGAAPEPAARSSRARSIGS